MKKLTLTQQIKQLREKRDVIDNDIDELELKKEAIISKNILKALKGTTFSMGDYGYLYYVNKTDKNKDDDFQKMIYADAELYPHGSKRLNENLTIRCSDSTIILEHMLCCKKSKQISDSNKLKNIENSNDAYYIESIKVGLQFAKDYGIKIEFYDLKRKIEELERRLSLSKLELAEFTKFVNED